MLQVVTGQPYACGPCWRAVSSKARSSAPSLGGRPERRSSASRSRPPSRNQVRQVRTRWGAVRNQRATPTTDAPSASIITACARCRTRSSSSVFTRWRSSSTLPSKAGMVHTSCPPWSKTCASSLRDWRLRLVGIIEASEKIGRYTSDMDFDAFAANEMAADAVTRNFGIIGEASRFIPGSIQAKYPDVPWRLMWDMRNVLIHDYPGVDLQVVWRTIKEDLPPTVARLGENLALERGDEVDTPPRAEKPSPTA